jgi:hypothetical protein
MTIDIKEFAETYSNYYRKLYYDRNFAATYEDTARDFYDMVLVKRDNVKAFLKRFCEYQMDIITSDREAAAFALAYSEYASIN